jgi:peptide/nickel transport system permease protein
VTHYVLRRLALLLPTLVVVGSIAFAITHALPGDPAAIMLGPEATPAQVADLRTDLALDDPLLQRYVAWMGDLVRLDLGRSIYLDRPVTDLLSERLAPTLQLAAYALVVAVAVGLPAGIAASRRPGSTLDRALTLLATSASAVAGFFLAILLILLFAVHLGWLPAGGSVALLEDPLGHARAMLLPALALGLPLAGVPARVVRASLLDVAEWDHVVAARARGIPRRSILLRHELRPALIPTTTVLGYSVGDLLGGAVIVETVFNLPGIGQLVASSIGQRDLLVLQGAVLLVAGFHVAASLMADVAYAALDPRLTHVRR